MERKRLVVFGLGARGTIYANFAKTYPEKFDLVAIIENSPERIEKAKKDGDKKDNYELLKSIINMISMLINHHLIVMVDI